VTQFPKITSKNNVNFEQGWIYWGRGTPQPWPEGMQGVLFFHNKAKIYYMMISEL
jgi:hypothetical protein